MISLYFRTDMTPVSVQYSASYATTDNAGRNCEIAFVNALAVSLDQALNGM